MRNGIFTMLPALGGAAILSMSGAGTAAEPNVKGKDVTAKVSGSRTKVTINGKKAQRKAVKIGMTCTFTYPGPGQAAKQVDCKG